MNKGSQMTGREFIRHLKGVRKTAEGWIARCPAHEDEHPSLCIKNDPDKLVVYCQAGCSFESILAQVPEARNARREVASYDYRDEFGNLLYQTVRLEPKGFLQRKPSEAGDWQYKLNGVRRVLYRWPELRDAEPDRSIAITEGEKDADNLRALGIAATTNAGGAGKWRREYSEALRGRTLVVLPDNDEPGRKHAHQVARSLHGIAASVKIIELPGLPDKG